MEHLKIKAKCKSDVILHNLFNNLFKLCRFLWKITLIKQKEVDSIKRLFMQDFSNF